MGCDIHGYIEGKLDYNMEPELEDDKRWDFLHWRCLGQIPIGRNYEVFAVLGDVRNYEDIPFIGKHRLTNVDEWIEEYGGDTPCREFQMLTKEWASDGHSHSFVTLAEMKAFDSTQKTYSHRLVTAKSETGAILATCEATTGKDYGEVGETCIFGPWGDGYWRKIIARLEQVKKAWDIASDEDVRLVFFFDN